MLPEALYLQKKQSFYQDLGSIDRVQGSGVSYDSGDFSLDVKPTQSTQVQTVSSPGKSGKFDLDKLTSFLNTGAGILQKYTQGQDTATPVPAQSNVMKYLPYVGGALALIIIVVLMKKKD